ncbi:MAG: trehalose-phosphatase [Burkholderiales bacterium]|nr:trehalose-phosphatase [Burkholderiales bacterium]
MPMHYLFTPEGDAALVAILRGRPLIALDFDGTLADIVDRPSDARIAPELALRLATLTEHLPVAIVTGRSVDDVKGRLGFEPQMIVGNHGAEGGFDLREEAARRAELDPLRRLLIAHQMQLSGAGIDIEDKGLSMALHYRLAPDADKALTLISDLLERLDYPVRTFAGKMVVNIVPLLAPDKGAAVHDLVAACTASGALFAGDDVNDEPVFESAPDHWLTIRVGQDHPESRAQYYINQPQEMQRLFDRMLSVLITPPASGTASPAKP